MNVLIIGSGAREHAIAWKLKQSPRLNQLFAIPGNPGIATLAVCAAIDVLDFDGIYQYCTATHIDLVVVGPEQPLCAGIVDYLVERGIRCFGPHRAAAILEGSKGYAKDFMIRHGIPTARYQRFDDATRAKAALTDYGLPVVIKADGLAAGKGVIIAETLPTAEQAIDAMLKGNAFGKAGNTIVIEEYLTGVEASQICFVDNSTIVPLASSQDYKRACDGDQGLNTGGMGNYSPSRLFDDALIRHVDQTILQPLLKGLQADGITYSGWIFIGLMIADGKAKVIEFNVRFGDPEAESILVRLDSDLLDLIDKSISNQLCNVDLQWSLAHSVVVVLASAGYPLQYNKGEVIAGLDAVEHALVFHAGTKYLADQLVTNGGRVLAVTALGKDVSTARTRAYQAVDAISFESKMYRKDIAAT